MDNKEVLDIIDKVVIDSAKSEKSCDSGVFPTDGNDSSEPVDKDTIKLRILEMSANNASHIYALMNKDEVAKEKERKSFFLFFKWLLAISLVFIAILIILNVLGKITLAIEIVIALFTYVIANIFAVIIIMAKYITQNAYLDTFKVVTHKLLDYLVDDKKANDEDKVK